MTIYCAAGLLSSLASHYVWAPAYHGAFVDMNFVAERHTAVNRYAVRLSLWIWSLVASHS